MKSSDGRLRRSRPLLGTFVTIELRADAPEAALGAWVTEGFEAIAEVERLMSRHRPGDLSRLNAAKPGTWIEVDPPTVAVLEAAIELYRASAGAFDIRCRADAPVAAAAPVEVVGTRARRTDAILDLDGIAKGYAVDRAVESVRRAVSGARNSGLVNAGGDMRAWGGASFPVLVRTTAGDDRAPLAYALNDAAIATSSIRVDRTRPGGLAPAVHVRMPSGAAVDVPATVSILAERCIHADALTKVALTAPLPLTERCLASYGARFLRFKRPAPRGRSIHRTARHRKMSGRPIPNPSSIGES